VTKWIELINQTKHNHQQQIKVIECTVAVQ